MSENLKILSIQKEIHLIPTPVLQHPHWWQLMLRQPNFDSWPQLNLYLKFNRSLGILYPLARRMLKSMLISIYYTPHTYSLSFTTVTLHIYDEPITIYDNMRLERAQNRAAWLITRTTLRTSTDGLWRELGWSSPIDRRKSADFSFTISLNSTPLFRPTSNQFFLMQYNNN